MFKFWQDIIFDEKQNKYASPEQAYISSVKK